MLTARAATSITKLALGISLVLAAAVGTVSPAQADGGFGFRHPVFFHNNNQSFFHDRFFFRDRFFFAFHNFGFPVVYPPPVVGYYPPVYYPPVYYPPPYYPPPSYYPPADYAPPANYSPPAAGSTPPQTSATGNCREFHQTISVDGKPVKASGTVCQQPDGSWRIMP